MPHVTRRVGGGGRHAPPTHRKRLALTAGLVAASLLVGALGHIGSAQAIACEDEFTGAGGGSWAVSGNWNHGVPSESTVVCWEFAKTVVVPAGSQAAASISSGGGL